MPSVEGGARARRNTQLERIDGRVRDLIDLPDGRRILPTFDEGRILEAAPELRQYQLALLSPGRVEVRLVLGKPLSTQQREALTVAFDAGLGRGFEYRFKQVVCIAKTPGSKGRPFVDGVDAAG